MVLKLKLILRSNTYNFFFYKSKRSVLPGFPPVNNIIKDPTFQSLMTQSILFFHKILLNILFMSKGRRSAGDGSGLCHYMGCSLYTVHCTLNTEHGGAKHSPGTRDMVGTW